MMILMMDFLEISSLGFQLKLSKSHLKKNNINYFHYSIYYFMVIINIFHEYLYLSIIILHFSHTWDY